MKPAFARAREDDLAAVRCDGDAGLRPQRR